MSYTYISRFSKEKQVKDKLPWSNEECLKQLGIEDILKQLEENKICFYQKGAWLCSVCEQRLFVYGQGGGGKLEMSPNKHRKLCPQFNKLIEKSGGAVSLTTTPQVDGNALSKIKTTDLTPQQHANLISDVVRQLYTCMLEENKEVIKRKGNPKDDYVGHL